MVIYFQKVDRLPWAPSTDWFADILYRKDAAPGTTAMKSFNVFFCNLPHEESEMKCPGQDMKYWKASAIFEAPCPKCSTSVEFYKDDTSRKCANCGHRFVNPKMDFGCASYCPYAEQCIGSLPEDFTGAKDNLLKDKVAVEVKRFFQTDFKKIRQATTTARFAENIGKKEGGNLAVILCSSYLHGIDSSDCENILNKVQANAKMVQEILELVNISDTIDGDCSLQQQILHDALILSHLQEQYKTGEIDATSLKKVSDQCFTTSARSLAAEMCN